MRLELEASEAFIMLNADIEKAKAAETEAKKATDAESEKAVNAESKKDTDADAKKVQNLQSKRRKLEKDELRKCRKDQPYVPLADTGPPSGHHRTIFSRASHLMPERKRLAEKLFLIAPIRSETGMAVLHDLIRLNKQTCEVSMRPGLEPDKCNCVDRPEEKKGAEAWKHIQACYRKQLLKFRQYKDSDSTAEFCYLCDE